VKGINYKLKKALLNVQFINSKTKQQIMPELPEIEAFKDFFESKALRKRIEKVEVKDEVVVLGKGKTFEKGMKNQIISSFTRYGKYLFADLEGGKTLMLHFGMTGNLKFYEDKAEVPKYTRVIFNLNGGGNVAFVCMRKLGRIGLVSSMKDFIKEQDLGPDAAKGLDWKAFSERLKGRSGKIKSILMNQQILAGIGNLYSDEILFQSGINPSTPVNKLKEEELQEIYKNMNSVLETVIKAQGKEELPQDFLRDHRKAGAECPRCAGEIIKETVGGRSAYFCRKHQEKI
jgi:formamidopyrimidine-DNA glycosylase